jgi:hypothetical protein
MKKSSKREMEKKKREKYFLNKVKSSYDGFPTGEIISCEGPDFLVSSATTIMGIELVDYMRGQGNEGSKRRHSESLSKMIVNLARAQFEKKYQIPLVVRLQWFMHKRPRKADARKLAVDIADLIVRNMPEQAYKSLSIERRRFKESLVGEFVACISVTRFEPGMTGNWANIEVDFIGVEADELQKLISSKDVKIQSYLQKCPSVWLVIIADGAHISSNVELHQVVHQHRFKGRFARVLFYDAVNNSIATLAISP